LFNEFIEKYKDIEVGGKIQINEKCIPPAHGLYQTAPVENSFVEYLKNNNNIFTIEFIQEFEDDVIILVGEVEGILGYDQVIPIIERKYKSKVFNWHREMRS